MDNCFEKTHSQFSWQTAKIESIEAISTKILRVVLRPNFWFKPRPGQHIDIRLTADDGFQAQRSYSLLSNPSCIGVYELGIELVESGVVSPWFHEERPVGETIEILGPVGGHFVIDDHDNEACLLIGGGSGVVPLLSMSSYRINQKIKKPTALLISARLSTDVILWPEIQAWEKISPKFHSKLALSRDIKVDRNIDRLGRLQKADISAALQRLEYPATYKSIQVFVCGNNSFVEAMTSFIQQCNIPNTSVRTERFGE